VFSYIIPGTLWYSGVSYFIFYFIFSQSSGAPTVPVSNSYLVVVFLENKT
jgi:hypothetical protein